MRVNPVRPLRVAVGVVVFLICCLFAHAGESQWKWPQVFGEGSSTGLRELHWEIHGLGQPPGEGFPVEDLTIKAESLEIHILKGAIFLEPAIRGRSAGAYFHGKAEVSFRPGTRYSQAKLTPLFAGPAIEKEPVSSIYFFSLRRESLVEQFGLSGVERVPFDQQEDHEKLKGSLRLSGTSLTHAFFEADGYAEGLFLATMSFDRIAVGRGHRTLVKYLFDPRQEKAISLGVAGHPRIATSSEYRDFFTTVSSCEGPNPWVRQADVELHDISMSLGGGSAKVSQTARLSMTLQGPLRTLSLSLTPRLQVSRVGLGERSLEFLQWKWRKNSLNRDQKVVVDLGRVFEKGEKIELEIESQGPLLMPRWAMWVLPAEDEWHPNIVGWGRSRYEIRADFPRTFEFVTVGELVDSHREGRREHVHYRLDKPVRNASFYFGNFVHREVEVGGTRLTVHLDKTLIADKALRDAVGGIKNATMFFSRLLGEIDQPRLHVVGTPTDHSRGFEGLLLVSLVNIMNRTPESKVHISHEVAHQWWGNLVLPKRWPEDRWLMESTAEYSAMEYFRAYCTKTGKLSIFSREFYNQWIKPLVWTKNIAHGTLYGAKARKPLHEFYPLGVGGRDVYTRGPMVLHMFRYMVVITKGDAEPFWRILREFNSRYRGERAGTEEFVALCNEVLGYDTSWFFDQWLWTGKIPTVLWSQSIKKEGDHWLLDIQAAQPENEPQMRLLIPVRLSFGQGRVFERTLEIRQGKGHLSVKVPQKPRKVELNPDWNALAVIKKK